MFTEEELAADLATMQSIPFLRFRSNFVRMSVKPGKLERSTRRRRGSEAMRALEKGHPGITLFLTLGVTHTVIQTIWEPIALDKGPYGLLAPFVDGMVLAASDSAKIVDGLEDAYPSRTPAQVENSVGVYDTAVVAFVTDLPRYRRVTSRSWGFWLDYDWRTTTSGSGWRRRAGGPSPANRRNCPRRTTRHCATPARDSLPEPLSATLRT